MFVYDNNGDGFDVYDVTMADHDLNALNCMNLRTRECKEFIHIVEIQFILKHQ